MTAKSRRPLIALTVRGEPDDDGRTHPIPYAYEWVPRAFAEGVVRAGGVPALISNTTETDDVASVLDRADGLLLTGGEDVDPSEFGETDTVGNLLALPERDRVELRAIAQADQIGMPILGICRGIQVLNIARGGNIWQDLEQQYASRLIEHTRGGSPHYRNVHKVDIAPGSRLRAILETDSIETVTSHHQAVRDLGGDLRVVARCPDDDVIEAIEEPGDRFCLAVEWHPEIRNGVPESDRIFAAFVQACRAYAADRTSRATA